MADSGADAHYQAVERIWDTARPVHHNTSRDFFDGLASEIQALLRPGGVRLLDAGCGAGDLIEILSTRGLDCYGFDFAQAKVDQAIQKAPGKIWKQSFLEQYPNAPFDYLTSYSVVQYCRPVDMPMLLMRVMEALKIGGQALLMAIPVMELFDQANHIHFRADTEAEFFACRRRFMIGAMEGRPVNDDGTFFHSIDKMTEIVAGFGHEVHSYPTGKSKYRMTLEIVRRH